MALVSWKDPVPAIVDGPGLLEGALVDVADVDADSALTLSKQSTISSQKFDHYMIITVITHHARSMWVNITYKSSFARSFLYFTHMFLFIAL